LQGNVNSNDGKSCNIVCRFTTTSAHSTGSFAVVILLVTQQPMA